MADCPKIRAGPEARSRFDIIDTELNLLIRGDTDKIGVIGDSPIKQVKVLINRPAEAVVEGFLYGGPVFIIGFHIGSYHVYGWYQTKKGNNQAGGDKTTDGRHHILRHNKKS